MGRPFTAILHSYSNYLTIWTDGCTSYGIGGWTSEGHYFSFKLPTTTLKNIKKYNKPDIMYIEFIGIVTALHILCHLYPHHLITIYCDNLPVQLSLSKLKIPKHRFDMLHPLRGLSPLLIKHNISLKLLPISTNDNFIADHLSRGRVQTALPLILHETHSSPVRIKVPGSLIKTFFNKYYCKDYLSSLSSLYKHFLKNSPDFSIIS